MSATIEQLDARHLEAARAFLARDSSHNLYLLGILDEFGIEPKAGVAPFTFHGKLDNGQIKAVLFVGGEGGLVVPSADASSDIGNIAATIANNVRLRSSIGDAAAVDTLVRYLCPQRPKISRRLRLYSVSADDLGPFTN